MGMVQAALDEKINVLNFQLRDLYLLPGKQVNALGSAPTAATSTTT